MIRVRFAPSPTGYLHVGNARTALFNYLFARHNNAKFILRIEDTDIERSKKEYEQIIFEDLKWLGLDWDEGPDVGGDYGPYRQSERLSIYPEYIEKLLKSGDAYYCYCSAEELEAERQKALKEGRPPRYSGKCRNLTPEERMDYEAKGIKPTIRFKVPDGETIYFQDLIKGDIEINVDEFGDFVIVRADGMPTYNFVVVIDDALMKISHVIRGEDHLSNTPKQILIYKALGFDVPQFAHMPIILGEDRSKLSKRHGAVSVRAFKDDGYISEALFNYMSLLGWRPKDEEKEIMSKEEIIEKFDIKDVHKSPAIFDKTKLRWMNGVYIREILDIEDLTNRAVPFFEGFGYKADFDYYKKVIEAIRDSIETLMDIEERAKPFFVDDFHYSEEGKQYLQDETGYRVVEAFYEKVKDLPTITKEDFKRITKEIQKELKVKGKALFMPIRVALTGETSGVDVATLVEVIGIEKVKHRLQRALEYFG